MNDKQYARLDEKIGEAMSLLNSVRWELSNTPIDAPSVERFNGVPVHVCEKAPVEGWKLVGPGNKCPFCQVELT